MKQGPGRGLPLTCNKLNSIPFRDKIMFDSYEKHNLGAENRTKFRMKKYKGSASGLCMKTFPLDKVVTRHSPFVLRVAS